MAGAGCGASSGGGGGGGSGGGGGGGGGGGSGADPPLRPIPPYHLPLAVLAPDRRSLSTPTPNPNPTHTSNVIVETSPPSIHETGHVYQPHTQNSLNFINIPHISKRVSTTQYVYLHTYILRLFSNRYFLTILMHVFAFIK